MFDDLIVPTTYIDKIKSIILCNPQIKNIKFKMLILYRFKSELAKCKIKTN